MTHQTLASGPSPATNYGNWGSTDYSQLGPRKVSALLVGMPGTGKTRFLLGCPGALILNFDRSPTPTTPKAQVLPVPRPDGTLVDASGSKVVWSWDYAETIRTKLIDAANANRPRPDMVVIDSLVSLVKLALDKFGDEFKDYKDVYSNVVEYVQSLHDAGYGVWVIGHVQLTWSKAKGAAPGDPPELIMDITHSRKLHARLFPWFSLVAQVEAEPTTQTIKKPRILPDGRQAGTIDEIVKTNRYTLSVDTTVIPGVVKRRVKLPSALELPENGAWDVFETAYNAAIKDSA